MAIIMPMTHCAITIDANFEKKKQIFKNNLWQKR